VTPVLLVYGAGVVVGLLRADAPLPTRLALALLWPLGPIAFVVTMTGLLGLALLKAPLAGLAVAGAAVAAWWIMR
jgi:hypothetical protein